MARNMIQETYLVSDKITPVDDVEIDKLEKAMGALPPGYREYLQRFGQKGEYEGAFHVKPPQFVMNDVAADRESLLLYASLEGEGYADWADEDVMPWGATINRAEINQAFVLGGNDNGDQIAFTPSQPNSVFLFHRHSEEVVEIEGGFLDPLLIAFHGERTDCFRFFAPSPPEIGWHIIDMAQIHPNDTIARWIQEYWGVDDKFRIQMPEFGDGSDPPNCLVFVKSIGGMCTVVDSPHNHAQYVQVMYDERRWLDRVAEFGRWLKERDK